MNSKNFISDIGQMLTVLKNPVIKNPFSHHTKISAIDKLTICINVFWLLPIRVFALINLTIIATFFAMILAIGLTDDDLKFKPLKGWRKKCKNILRIIGRAIAFCFGFHKIKILGKIASRKQSTIFVAAPHSSIFDFFILFILDLPCVVTKFENASFPLIGPLIKIIQPIFVNRKDSINKKLVINEIKKRADYKSEWPQLLLFPEATTTNHACLIAFKLGAFIPGLPVQPIAIKYNNKVDTVTWTWDGFNAFEVLFLTLCQFNNYMEVSFLPVYIPNIKESEDIKLYSRNVRSKIADQLGIGTTSHTYEDCRLMLKARELKLPFESGLIEFEKMNELMNEFNYEDYQQLFEIFSTVTIRSNGKMNFNNFCAYFNLPFDDKTRIYFKMLDTDNDNFINFREFLIYFYYFPSCKST